MSTTASTPSAASAASTTASTTAAHHARGAAGSPEAPTARTPAPLGWAARRLRLRTTPGQIRAFAVAGLLAVLALFAVTATAIGNARDGVQTIGHDAGPQVVATGTLFFALSDMDAQAANVLLIGKESGLGREREASKRRYKLRRAQASRALIQAAQLAGDDLPQQQTVLSVFDGLGRYERLVAQAITLDEQARRAAGPPPQEVIDIYRLGTGLMKLELLPKAYNLTLDSGATVRQTYAAKRSAVLTGRAWVWLAGLVVVGVLAGAQVFLARRFRRVVNPALALATLVVLVLVVAGTGLLSAQADQLRRAKQDGFDSVLALSRARAISNSAFGDESRYLLDPGRADTYEQVYLDKAQSVLYTEAGNLEEYYRGVDTAVRQFSAGRGQASFLGFFGDEVRHVGSAGQGSTLVETLSDTLVSYQQVQQNDSRMRELANANRRQDAVALRMGRDSGAVGAFNRYDGSLVALTAAHDRAFDRAIASADDGLRGWDVMLPGAAIAVAVLILIGVRPRLAEYR
jgi:hypothetical protein